MLKSFMLFMAVVLLVLTCSSAPVGQAQETSGGKAAAKSTTPAPDSHAKAKKLYDLDCALCHGANGDGKTDLGKDMQLTMLDWTDPKSLAGMSDQAIFDAIRKGKGKMPPEDDARAKNDEVKGLARRRMELPRLSHLRSQLQESRFGSVLAVVRTPQGRVQKLSFSG